MGVDVRLSGVRDNACAAARSAASRWSSRPVEAVRFEITSVDVIHSFWIPALRYKHDAIPGSTQIATLVFSRGVFPGQCAEFCGLRHADMIFTADALSPAAFTAWARSRGTAPLP